ncbi:MULTISPECIES: Pr6Pr family membrane protein [unclassified Brachybacterium]|uniref:Pr6Pr family membrane protein n=1 Tax=unclassified Brachybacterium TaxID=2623841 RepID=UPI003609454E
METSLDPRRRAASRWWHGTVAAVVLVALLIQFALVLTGGQDANSGDSGEQAGLAVRLGRFLSYFTVESNIVVVVVSALLAIDPLRRGAWWEIARLYSLLAITITGVVFALVLAPQLELEGWSSVASFGLHTVSPVLTVVGWLVFGPRRRFRWSTVAGAFAVAAVWLLYIFGQGSITHWYPYPFLDAAHLGIIPAVVNALLVVAVAALLAVVIRAVDRAVPAMLRENGPNAADSGTAASSGTLNSRG